MGSSAAVFKIQQIREILEGQGNRPVWLFTRERCKLGNVQSVEQDGDGYVIFKVQNLSIASGKVRYPRYRCKISKIEIIREKFFYREDYWAFHCPNVKEVAMGELALRIKFQAIKDAFIADQNRADYRYPLLKSGERTTKGWVINLERMGDDRIKFDVTKYSYRGMADVKYPLLSYHCKLTDVEIVRETYSPHDEDYFEYHAPRVYKVKADGK